MDKPPLLLLHGALGSQAQFSPFLPHLEASFQLHTLDFEGHGTAGATDRAFRIEHFAENVLAYLDTHALPAINIFGHSMGGYVGLYLAKNQPGRVHKVFTLGTKFAWTPEFAQQEIASFDADKMLQKVPRFAQLLQERHASSDWKTALEKTRVMMLELGEKPVLVAESLAQIQAVVRIGLGDRDGMVSLEESIEVYRTLPHGQLQIFPSTLHPLEKISIPVLASAMTSFFVE